MTRRRDAAVVLSRRSRRWAFGVKHDGFRFIVRRPRPGGLLAANSRLEQQYAAILYQWRGGSLMRQILLAVLAAALVAGNAEAQHGYEITSANDMVPKCKKFLAPREGEDTLATAWGQGVCVATIDSLMQVAPMFPPHLRSCPPKEVTIGQSVRVVLAYIERRPQRMHENFRGLTVEAIHEAWPCR
jgi:Ssp1 endopeptidase immunity protein Rap1a